MPCPPALAAERTVAAEVVAALLANGVDTMYGVAGTHTLTLLGAVEREPALHYITARTEIGATAMAVGHARATGRPAAVLTSTGPGALNALSELADARWGSLPLVHITTSIGEDTFAGAVHETPEQSDLMRRVGKACIHVAGGEVHDAVSRVVGIAMSTPRGPVTLDLRVGSLGNLAEAAYGDDDEWVEPLRAPASDDLAAIRDAIDRAERPVMFVGGGALAGDRGRAVRELAERVGAPIVTSYQGKAIADGGSPGYLGPWASEAQVQTLFADADLALVFGSKLSSSGTDQWRLPLSGPGYRVDAAPGLHRHYPELRTLAADAGTVATRLAATLTPRAPWAADRVADIRRSVETAARERGPVEMSYVDAIDHGSATPRLVSYDMSKAAFWAIKYVAAAPGSVHALSSYLAMGTALPMAIGMAVATGEPVLAILGDGGLQMSIAELATLVELHLPVTLLVLVDHAYGLLRDNGRLVAGSEKVGVALWNPDFDVLARAYGMPCLSLANAADLAEVLEKPAAGPRLVLLTEAFARRW
jgi:acetolactate synthase-1/2/3 large subunit